MIKITKIKEKIPVYDIEVEDNHNFFANGLCAHNCEILQPSHSLDGYNHITQKHNDTIPEIGVCILGNMNLGYAKYDDIPKVANFLVRFLDTLIDESDFGMKEIEYAAVNRRGLGIGISNLFGFLAKSKLFYNTVEAREVVNRYMECLSYHLHKTSIELAKEKGKCELFADTIYSDLQFPHERKEIQNMSKDKVWFKSELDWDSLRDMLEKYGIRNSSLMAIPPAGNCIRWDMRIKTQEGNLNLADVCKRENIDVESLVKGWYKLKTPIKLQTKDGESVANKFYYNGAEKVYNIELEDGKTIHITKNHKLLVKKNNGRTYWVKAKDLKEGDDIQTIEETMKIKKIEISQTPEITWDLEVENYHNYILENGVISHNSAEISNSTNGVEPPRELVTLKTDKAFTFKKLVPYFKTSSKYYTTAWSDEFNNTEYLKLICVIQRWTDQAISLNLYSNLLSNPKVKIGELIALLVESFNLGIKTWYYQNFRTTEDDNETNNVGCGSGGCSV